MKVLYIPIPEIMHPWYEDFIAALGGRYPVELYDPDQPLEQQFRGTEVVVELGGNLATHEMIDAGAQAGVKLWQISGTGLDEVHVGHFERVGIPLANTPGLYSGAALAEHALFLMLCHAKNFRAGQQSISQRRLCDPINGELGGKTLGLVGLGASGGELAQRASSMGMRVMAVDKVEVPREMLDRLGVEFFGAPSQLDRILGEADYLSLHVPLTAETRHMIRRHTFRKMKPTSVLINVSRGEIVDQAALLEALNSGWIGGAGLDVFPDEPVDPGHPLLQSQKVIATPHVAGVTYETSRRRGQACADNVVRIAEGLHPLNLVST